MDKFERIYIEHFNNVYKYVLSLCRNEELAEEITQETFYKAIRKLDEFDGKCKLYVWLCQIAKNTYYSYLKKQKKYSTEEIDDNKLFDNGINVIDKVTAFHLHQLLHELEEPYKEVFTLRIYADLPFSQIGELFNKSDSWARLIFYRAKLKIRRKLDEDIM